MSDFVSFIIFDFIALLIPEPKCKNFLALKQSKLLYLTLKGFILK